MAALLLEGAVADALTLNFDLAARTALAELGAGVSVSTIRGPDEHAEIGTRNLIYLHRDIDSPADELILRTAQLDEAWREHWQEVIARRVLAGPVTVFVGLGSPASVLVETTQRIRAALGTPQAGVYVVDPLAHEDSRFAAALKIPAEDYFRMGWGEFMRMLAQRLVEEHRAALEQDCAALIKDLDIETEDVTDLCGRLSEIGLLGLGRLRAAWMLDSGSYLPHSPGTPLHLFSNLVLAIRMVERVSGRQARFDEDGLVEFSTDGYVTRVMVCSGNGWMTGARVEAELNKRRQAMQRLGRAPLVALVSGVEPGPDTATPSNIAGSSHPDDLVTGPSLLRIISVHELRSDPSLVRQVIQ